MSKTSLESLRKQVLAMSGYTPGEQPQTGEIIKLNTNENPYGPSPHVIEALKAAITGDRLRKYPDPMGTRFRKAAGAALGIDPDSILIGNGSDDCLTILTRSFVPESGLIVSPTPSYLLYKTLAEIQCARFETVAFTNDWKVPNPWPVTNANLLYLANPNSPSGTVVNSAEIDMLLGQISCPLVIDEAYGDFSHENQLWRFQQNQSAQGVIITRTMSKSYSLAGIRFGFAVAEPQIVHQLNKVKDSYNCDVLSLEAATAAISDQAYLRQVVARICETRKRLESNLVFLGFDIIPSQANFVWCTHPAHPSSRLYEELKKKNILVRLMKYPTHEGLRITVGSDPEIDQLLAQLRNIV